MVVEAVVVIVIAAARLLLEEVRIEIYYSSRIEPYLVIVICDDCIQIMYVNISYLLLRPYHQSE